jgi:putative transposase
MSQQDHHPQFFTATILEWRPVLLDDPYKDIVINSMQFLVKQHRCKIFGFVIMPNHLHMVWQIGSGFKRADVQRDFLKFTAQQIKSRLKKQDRSLLEDLRVATSDREYQVWERNALSIDLYHSTILLQKLSYIHCNPIQDRWGLSQTPEAYKYSSARFYEDGVDDWGFLTQYII